MLEIKCDNCGNDLTETTNSINWRLSLSNEQIPSHDGAVTDMMILQPIKKDVHFCGVGCLRVWINKHHSDLKDVEK